MNSVKNYLELMRLDKRVGIYLILWPCLWSIAIAAKGTFPYIIYLKFILGAVIMRGAGCVINDILDVKIDSQVERTKKRLLPSGKIKIKHAYVFLALLLLIGATILYSLNNISRLLGVFIVVPMFLYPLMKRITYWPQAFLGLTFNWGALMGAAAIKGHITYSSVVLYIGCFFWTMAYDTIYAHQDKESDAKAGVKSTALLFGHNTKKYLYIFYSITVVCLWNAGVSADLGITYHALLIIGTLQLLWQVHEVNLDRPTDCMRKFCSNNFFGFIIFLGIMGGYWH